MKKPNLNQDEILAMYEVYMDAYDEMARESNEYDNKAEFD